MLRYATLLKWDHGSHVALCRSFVHAAILRQDLGADVALMRYAALFSFRLRAHNQRVGYSNALRQNLGVDVALMR